MKSIKEQYEERYNKTYFIIKWEYDNDETPINPNKFKREIKEFVKGFQPTQGVSSISFILCFSAVKTLSFLNCMFSKKNYKNFKELKNLKLYKLELYQNIFSTKYLSNLFKSLSFNKNSLKVDIRERVQDKIIISAIKNILKTNKIIKSLKCGDSSQFKKISEEDIIELQEIVDSHPSILGLQVYGSFIEPKGKTKMLKKLVLFAL
eukprot:snap_masked-scaffold_26-processed-gene-3.25-mRNA-1 protein AED:1.00 eAED:1.00 QI:0/0/0/0/1/1/6/0/205